MSDNIEGKIVVITGARSGLGVIRRGGETVGVANDVTRRDRFERPAEEAVRTFGRMPEQKTDVGINDILS
jgi:NAD(P)-dependent dehydrogenase (short-subunit alcohol dehydrogenase family)